jgi:hypothetical protein
VYAFRSSGSSTRKREPAIQQFLPHVSWLTPVLRRSILVWMRAPLGNGQYPAVETRQEKANRFAREIVMTLKSSVLVMRSLVVAASVAAACVPTVRDHDAGAASISSQTRADQSVSAPIVVAQGRCYNGKCY